jgi:hypothetical protein
MRVLIAILRFLGIAQLPDVFRDISNYFFIRRKIAEVEGTEDFKRLKLNKAWLGVTYAVVNLPPEVVAAPPQTWEIYMMDKIVEYDVYFQSIGLTEIVIPRLDRLIVEDDGVYAYGIRFVPLRLELDIWYVIWTGIVWTGIFFGASALAGLW